MERRHLKIPSSQITSTTFAILFIRLCYLIFKHKKTSPKIHTYPLPQDEVSLLHAGFGHDSSCAFFLGM
jgi:hypothetical protein